MKVEVTKGIVRPQDMNPFTEDDWSGNSHVWWTGAKPGDRLTLQVPVAEPGRYEVIVVLTKARDYAIVELEFEGNTAVSYDLYMPNVVVATPATTLGTMDLTPGDHTLTVEITGKNVHAVPSYMFGLDYVLLRRVE